MGFLNLHSFYTTFMFRLPAKSDVHMSSHLESMRCFYCFIVLLFYSLKMIRKRVETSGYFDYFYVIYVNNLGYCLTTHTKTAVDSCLPSIYIIVIFNIYRRNRSLRWSTECRGQLRGSMRKRRWDRIKYITEVYGACRSLYECHAHSINIYTYNWSITIISLSFDLN